MSALKLISLLFFPILSLAQNGSGDNLRISTSEEIKSEFSSVPCKNDRRLDAVKALFEKMGARTHEIKIEKFKNVENLTVTKPGVAPETANQKIVIGAHYDKTEAGCGAVDNWTGIVALAHIYRALKDAPLKKTVVFVAFGKEEKGLVGSSAMVSAMRKEQSADYCAMVNIDTIGLAAPHVADNMSSRKLLDFTATVAQEMKIPFSNNSIPGADSDSSPFVRKKIPAVTILGMGSDWRRVLHTGNDQAEMINPQFVHLGYRLALELLVRIDSAECRAFRD